MDIPLNQGVFLLSIDTELAWGGVYNGSFRRRLGHYQRTREAIDRLLALLERYEVRATWAIVGHLFLDRCQVEDGGKHTEIIRPSYPWFTGDWFDVDPGTDLQTDPFWYGSDIVEKIRNCKVPQEIGSHGFSHTIIGEPGCSRESFDSELKACLAQAERWGITLESFVFPRNSVGHLDILAENGFKVFRGPAPAWQASLPGPLRRLARLLESLLPTPPPVTTPKPIPSEAKGLASGLWDLPASYFYPHRDGWARLVPVSLSVYKARLGLRRAVRQRAMFHLWFHPFNLASDLDALLQGLERIFAEVHTLQKSGQLTNTTMGDLAASFQPVNRRLDGHE